MAANFSIEEVVPTASEIMTAVVNHYGLEKIDMVSRRRAREVARPRQVAMYLSRKLTLLSFPNIGKIFGNRNHSTVIRACRRVEELIATDRTTREAVEAVQQRFKRGEG